jgi:hypothetical protein
MLNLFTKNPDKIFGDNGVRVRAVVPGGNSNLIVLSSLEINKLLWGSPADVNLRITITLAQGDPNKCREMENLKYKREILIMCDDLGVPRLFDGC